MRRILPSLAAAVTCVGLLAACGDTGDGQASDCTPDSTVTVHGQDSLSFDQDAYEADTAGCVGFEYVNDGSVAHTLLVRGERGFKLSMGRSDEGALELDAGSYEIYCDVAGHEAAGMVADLTVG